MTAPTLKVAAIQTYLHWEDKLTNVEMLSAKIRTVDNDTDIIVLPEMFTTGFTMRPEKFAERMYGDSLMWLSVLAAEKNQVICGSIIIKEHQHFYNRFVWVQPDSQILYYDKHHLFTLGNEHQHYTAGQTKTIITYKGWKIRPAICYDLRFPTWLRNRVVENNYDYDILIIPANWPQRRNTAWKALLQARAIENQAYVIGVNRVGNDGNAIYHSGDSMCIDALGEIQFQQADEEKIVYAQLEKNALDQIRTQLPFLKDE